MAREVCEAACYDCLMNYANEPDHALLDCKDIREFLLSTRATVLTAPAELTRAEHLERICRLTGSGVEEAVRFVSNLPSFPALRTLVLAERADRSGLQVLGQAVILDNCAARN